MTPVIHERVEHPEGPILFFDGVCSLCNTSVDLVMRHDRRKLIRFASLQSPFCEQFLRRNDAWPLHHDSIVLWEGGRVYHRSDAALRVAMLLGGVWYAVAVAYLIPRSLRNAVYDAIARRRSRWFGTRDTCRMPTPEERSRFLG